MKKVFQICLVLLNLFLGSDLDAQIQRHVDAGIEKAKEQGCSIIGKNTGFVAGAVAGAALASKAPIPHPIVKGATTLAGGVAGGFAGAFAEGVCSSIVSSPNTSVVTFENNEVVIRPAGSGSSGSGSGGGGGYPVVRTTATRIVRH